MGDLQINKLKLNEHDIYTPDYYVICNKDRELCRFLWKGKTAIDLDISNVDGLENLPEFVSRDIYSWLQSRTPPKHRAFMRELLQQLGDRSDRAIINFSKGLSLTDTLWVKRDSEQLNWSKVSLYTNSFDTTISQIAFDGGLHGKAFKTTSPEFATDGMLPKCWVRESDGSIHLKKAGTTGALNAGNEPYSEAMASQVLDKLGYSHVKYSLENFRGRVVSSCHLMTSEEVSLIPLYRLCNTGNFNSIRRCVEEFGFGLDFYRMLIFDYLSLNTDRHLGNFGVLVDSETFEPLCLAPIFDNGASMLCYYTGYQSLNTYLISAVPAMYSSFEDTIYYWKSLVGNNHNVGRLLNFSLSREEYPLVPVERVHLIEQFICKRAREFLSL